MTANGSGDQPDPSTEQQQMSDWHARITTAATTIPPPVVAQKHIRALPGGSRAQLFACDDGRRYAVKLRGNPHGSGRGMFTEQVVARLGRLIGAPVPEVRLITVTAELLASLNIDLGGNPAEPGLQHGSCWAEGFSDRMGFVRYSDRNRQEFAALHLLYSWLYCTGDHQVIYRNAEPHEVLSVDHGAFLPGSHGWTADTLRANQDSVQLDPAFNVLSLTEGEYKPTLDRLAVVTREAIAGVAAAPPAEWAITLEDRAAFAGYAEQRRLRLLAAFGR